MLFVHAAGQQQAQLQEGGQVRLASGYVYHSPQLQSLGGAGRYQAGGGKVTVQEGDTLRSLAQRTYGNAGLWYVLAEANGLSDPEGALTAGTQLDAPSVQVNANDAGTFQPYNPNEAIGSTTPSLPYITPPPEPQCEALSRVLSVVVTIVVGYYAGAAAGAAAGNLTYQGTQLMFNGQYDWGRLAKFIVNPFAGNSEDLARTVYDPLANGAPGKIDYKSVAISGAAAYVGSYVGSGVGAATGSSVVGAATGAGVSYGVNYQLSKEAGYDVSFSLREMGASMGTAAAGSVVSGELKVPGSQVPGTNVTIRNQSFTWNTVVRQVTADVLTSAAGYGIRKGFGLEAHWSWSDVAADAFGNALGNAVVGGIQSARERRASELATIDQFNKALEGKSAYEILTGRSETDQKARKAALKGMNDAGLEVSLGTHSLEPGTADPMDPQPPRSENQIDQMYGLLKADNRIRPDGLTTFEVGQAATREANQKLLEAGAFRAYKTQAEAEQAFADNVGGLQNKYDTELGAYIYEGKNGFAIGLAYASGNGSELTGFWDTPLLSNIDPIGFIHTHPNSPFFSGADLMYGPGMAKFMPDGDWNYYGDLELAVDRRLDAAVVQNGKVFRFDYQAFEAGWQRAQTSNYPYVRVGDYVTPRDLTPDREVGSND